MALTTARSCAVRHARTHCQDLRHAAGADVAGVRLAADTAERIVRAGDDAQGLLDADWWRTGRGLVDTVRRCPHLFPEATATGRPCTRTRFCTLCSSALDLWFVISAYIS